MGRRSTDHTRRRFLGGAAALGLAAVLPGCADDDDATIDRAGTSSLPPGGPDLPVNDTAELQAIFDPRFEPLGQRVTRIGLYDLTDGFDRSDTGDHLAIYVEPIDPDGEGWDDARYLEMAVPGMAAATPFAFEEWAGLNSVDVCQEPPQSANASPEPPIETQLLVDRATSEQIDWATAELSDLLAAAERSPDEVTVAARGPEAAPVVGRRGGGGRRAGVRRHDHDAGGDPDLLRLKADLREDTWSRMSVEGIGRFPRPDGRIPNFVGAEAAAERLRATPAWAAADTVKANPDSPQWPVRQRALEDGKVVYMAVPRLAEEHPFFLLDPDDLADTPRKASSIKGASRSARTVPVSELRPVDLVVTGCVAVDETGARLGKGGGFSDLEFAVAAEAGLIGPDTVVATTVHEVQVREAGEIPMADHDLRLDLIVTPDRVIECRSDRPAPGIDWSQLTDDKIAAIPLLRRLAADRAGG